MSKPAVEGERRLAAIMFTDLVGYTALAQKNETRAVELLEEHRILLRSIFEVHNGRIIDTIGDGCLVEFPSATDSVNCAVKIQTLLKEMNDRRSEDSKITLRIGIHLGDVIHKRDKVIGDTVNVASRIQPLAPPGGICITQQVLDNVRNKVQYSIIPFGTHELNHVELPLAIYTVILPWEEGNISGPRVQGHLEEQTLEKEIEIPESKFPSGIGSLDEILGGGYHSQSAILVIGPPGIAKEVLGYWFTHNGLEHGDYCLYATRLAVRDILRDAKAFGIDYSQKGPLWMANRGGHYKLALNDLPYLLFNIKDILSKNEVQSMRIVTDIVSSLLLLNQPEPIYLFLSQLIEKIKQHNAVLLATIEDGMHPSQVLTTIEHLFDGVIELKLFEEGMRAKPLLRILKMRGTQADQGYFSFSFNRNGMEISRYA